MNCPQELIAGVDEVGRGCLFGPVFAGAVVLTETASQYLIKKGLRDSKKLSSKRRTTLIPEIKRTALAWGLGQASSKEIDTNGIRTATELAMLRAIQKLPDPPNLLLIDGVLPLRLWEGPQKTLIKGDNHCPAIAAASVLAKQARDELLQRLEQKFPGYGLKTNMGYGTAFHREALIKEGPTPLHRHSFLTKLFTN